MNLIQSFYQNKRILITGHTGFKGSWLSLLLKELGSQVIGYGLNPEVNRDSLFVKAKIENKIESYIADIRDFKKLKEVLEQAKPDIIFHLAAQSLVRSSYVDPIYNYETNIMGTVNLLEASKKIESLKALVNITTDKCYENKERGKFYNENDRLGGHDPYSASKACSEIITNSYRKSFYKKLNIGLASARAGNVIGGGDFSKDRIIPDVIESIKRQKNVILRNPMAVRPWQHIFDVLNGYLLLGHNLYNNPTKFSESFNFSPIENKEVNVEEIVSSFISVIGTGNYVINTSEENHHEAQILKLDSSKARKRLKWVPKYKIEDAVTKTALWYKDYLINSDVECLCKRELINFIRL